MSQTLLPTDLYVSGNLSAKTFTPPAGCITDAAVQGNAGVQASKLQHQYQPCYAQGSSTSATAATQVIYAVQGANATIVGFSAGAVVPAVGNDTCTVDLRKNGTTVLSATISLDHTQSARQLVAGTLSTTTAVAGDVFEIVVTPTHNTGTLAQGIFCRLEIQESAQ